MDTLRTTAPDPALLPCAFDAGQLWSITLVDTRFGGQIEQLVLCDADDIDQLRREHEHAGRSLVMAFSLAHLRRLHSAIAADAADADVIDAAALGVARTWPSWMPASPTMFIALAHERSRAVSLWVRASSRAEALAAIARSNPQAQVMGAGSLAEFEDHLARLERVLSGQDFGALARDVRSSVDRPATQAHILGFPLASMGLFPSPAHAMASHQAMFLEDEAELAAGH